MKTIVYVDGFNLYYGAVKGTPYRWLNLGRMCALLLPHDRIHQIKYFTALVNPRQHDPDQRVRQETYLRALATIPNLSVTLGYFLTHEVTMPLAGGKGGQNPNNPDTLRQHEAIRNWCRKRGMTFVVVTK